MIYPFLFNPMSILYSVQLYMVKPLPSLLFYAKSVRTLGCKKQELKVIDKWLLAAAVEDIKNKKRSIFEVGAVVKIDEG